ncbi:MAG: hypothetical protein IJY23_06600 [Clostridia bacterium]|nr:hypothetical protein [Clostridia bacterium]
MTLNQLLSEVYALGFEDSFEINDVFIFSANRALRLIFLELASPRVAKIHVRREDVCYRLDRYTHTPGTSFEIKTDSARAYSFRAYGNGEYTIIDNNGSQIKRFTGAVSESRGVFSGDGKIVFTGDFSYTVTDLSLFSSLKDGNLSSIPIVSDTIQIDLKKYIGDLLCATNAPTDASGKAIPGAAVLGDTLILPEDFSGEVTVYYKPSPNTIGVDDLNYSIDMPKLFEPLLPLLTAAYLWLDDDEEKSQYYMNIYKDEAAKIRLTLMRAHNSSYTDTTGWA